MNPPDPITPNLRAAVPESEAPLSSATAGPGRVIRQARERAKLGIEDLASQTRLARSTLEALERDDFSQLNEAVYVRGYYRKCAKVLALPEAELIAAYDKLYAPKHAPMPTKMPIGHSGSTMGASTPAGGSASSWSIVIVIAAMLGAGAWFVTQDRGEIVAPPLAVVTDGTVPPAGDAQPAAAFDAAGPTGATVSGPALAVAGSLSDPAAASTVPAPVVSTPGLELAPATTLANVNPEPSVPAADPAPAAAPASTVSASDPGALVLGFKSASWVRIEDADGRLLLSGTIQSGDRQVLKGRTPYSLFIGYAPGVSVEFDGKPFDLAPHIRQNSTARINLPYVAAPPATAPAP